MLFKPFLETLLVICMLARHKNRLLSYWKIFCTDWTHRHLYFIILQDLSIRFLYFYNFQLFNYLWVSTVGISRHLVQLHPNCVENPNQFSWSTLNRSEIFFSESSFDKLFSCDCANLGTHLNKLSQKINAYSNILKYWLYGISCPAIVIILRVRICLIFFLTQNFNGFRPTGFTFCIFL